MNSSAQRIFVSWFTFWVAVAAIGIYFLFPLREKLNFGIDLVGGAFLTLEVQTAKAVESELLSRMQSLPDRLKEADKSEPISSVVKGNEIVLTFSDVSSAQAAALVLSDTERDLKQTVKGEIVSLHFTEAEANKIKRNAVLTNKEVLSSRLNVRNVEEITVAQKGDDQIVVELPNVDPQKARAKIGKPAILEFKLVESAKPTEADIKYEYDVIPEDMEIVPHRDRKDGKPKEYFLVPKFTDITGKMLRKAYSGYGGPTGSQRVVHFEFKPEGSNKFYELTRKNPNRQLAIILDGQVITAPDIGEPISGGKGYIRGNFTAEWARELSVLLNSGALVAPVTIVEDRHIGATLGEDSIKKGLFACFVGLGLLFVFSLFYYKLAGLFAFVALLFNLVLVLMGLSYMRAALTLPGIAGMILTIGMAIDASILIFERIKEKLAAGVSIKQAVNSGFKSAMVVILDANITTLIVAIVLYRFGTGPIRGFSVTMMLGIIATLITGLLFLRSIFNYILSNFNIKKLSI